MSDFTYLRHQIFGGGNPGGCQLHPSFAQHAGGPCIAGIEEVKRSASIVEAAITVEAE